MVDGWSDEQGDDAFRKGNEGEQDHADDEAEGVRLNISEQPAKLW